MGAIGFAFCRTRLRNLSLEEILVEIYKREWTSYWYDEVRNLSEEPLIARAILTAVAYENTDDGFEVEDLLMELFHDRYGKSWDLGVMRSREYRKSKSYDTMKLPPEIDKRLFR